MIKYVEERLPKSAEYVRNNLVPDTICNCCGAYVLRSKLEGHPYQCMYCDEDLRKEETHKTTKEISDFDFEDLVEKTQELLSLDEEKEVK